MRRCLTPEEVDGFAKNMLPYEARLAVEDHIESCEPCRLAAVAGELAAFLPEAGEPADRPGTPVITDVAGAALPERIGPFRVLEELGRGGQAQVFLAEDTRLPRRVAVKVLRAAHAPARDALVRFEREAAALARLEHPGICAVYETGEWQGSRYIVMRHVEGTTLARVVAARVATSGGGAKPDADDHVQRMVLVIERVARALHVAHQAGLVHRDIKPSNIMLAPGDEPVLLDFGLVHDETCQHSALTRAGDIVGTPVYMSPEQITGPLEAVDRRSDVFSLGVTLYEALTLHLPFSAPTAFEAARRITHEPPPDPRSLEPRISRDLRVILETALEKQPVRRYATALALAEDLRRLRMREPIHARPAGPVRRAQRWAQRNPATAASVVALFVILATGLGIALVLLEQVARESAAKTNALLREAGERMAFQALSVVGDNPGQALLLALEAAKLSKDTSAQNALLTALEANRERRRLLGHEGAVGKVAFNRDGTLVATAAADATARVWDAGSGQAVAVLRGHQRRVRSVAFSSDGARVVTASDDALAMTWDAATGRRLATLHGHSKPLLDACFSPGDRLVLTVSQDAARLWHANTGEPVFPLQPDAGEILCGCFSPGGETVATGSSDGVVRLWDGASGRQAAAFGGQDLGAAAVCFSEDGRRLAAASLGGIASVWDLASQRQVTRVEKRGPGFYCVAFSPDGTRIAAGSEDFTARIWDVETGAELMTLRHLHKVISIDFSPDGTLLATASYDTTARLWDATTGRESAVFKGHAAPLQHVAFSPDGTLVATAGIDFTCRLWGRRPQGITPLAHDGNALSGCAVSPRGTTIACVPSAGGQVRFWNAATGQALDTVGRGIEGKDALDFSPDGAFLATASDNAVRLWRVADGKLVASTRHQGTVHSVSFGRGGRFLVTASADGTARVWRAGDLAEAATLGHGVPVRDAHLSADSLLVVTAAADATVRVWDAVEGKELARAKEAPVATSADFGADGRIASTGFSTRARVWDFRSGRTVAVLAHSYRAVRARYSPDGRWIATVAQDWIVRIWSAVTFEEVLAMRKADRVVPHLSFDENGDHVLVLWSEQVTRAELATQPVLYPLDPLAVARGVVASELTPDERDHFRVGSAEDRAEIRRRWQGGHIYGPSRDVER